MILVGIDCHGCGGPLLDQGDRCGRCNHPFNAFILMIIARHTATKDALVARADKKSSDDHELMTNITRLADATTMLSDVAREAENKPLSQEESQKCLDRAFQHVDEALSS